MTALAIDPGREKCGVAVVAGDGRVLEQSVVATARLADEITARVRQFAPDIIVLGNGTTSRSAEETLRKARPEIPIAVVDEYRTTDDARIAYWKAHPPTGWRRILPTGMQVPPVPVDDFVAVILAQRYLGTVPK
ncbi:MAG: pre-16S rRNA-processing nuclease YqgF [Schwartzia sp.]|nr:pre-16S rRNA-processing nuclease YqgF [Schwartzia sp. (in: firmicutes)]MBR1761146.1 pre-16S rRNA-processing nuclease YqgF [Schwartzia sp. (in: firmicutes)]MBR1884850.1 pre-16S rRNA-processing nuclease YqgF [Schwartzia sp. (in: firmicutes)]